MNRLKTSIIGVAVFLFLAAAVSSRVAVSRSTPKMPAAQVAVANQTTMQTGTARRPPTGQANVATNVDEVQCEVDDEVTSCSPPNVCFPQEAPTAFNDETNDLVDQTRARAPRRPDRTTSAAKTPSAT